MISEIVQRFLSDLASVTGGRAVSIDLDTNAYLAMRTEASTLMRFSSVSHTYNSDTLSLYGPMGVTVLRYGRVAGDPCAYCGAPKAAKTRCDNCGAP
jgi:hypothetical protein